jgi:hypothetical protein
MFSTSFIKKSLTILILFLFLKTSMSLTLNDSFYLNENETYYEFSQNITSNNIININFDNLIIDGKNNYFQGQFNINSKNITFINLIFNSYDNFILATDSNIKILNSKFNNSNNAIILTNSNFSIINNSFNNINNLININSTSFFANISENKINNVINSFYITSSSLITDEKINLNLKISNFYELFKILGNESTNYFNSKQFFNHENIIYEVVNNYDELLNLIKTKSKNIALGNNITATKTLSLINDVNIYGKNNYFNSNISREYSIVLIGDINFNIDSLNIISNSNLAISNMGATVNIINCELFVKNTGFYQLEGILNISNSNLYFLNESENNIGIHIESGQANISNTKFYNANIGIIALTDSLINGIKPLCSNHSVYKTRITNLENVFNQNSIIIPEKSTIYEKEYDYFKGITIQNIEQDLSCSYPGFIYNNEYPWETEYKNILNQIKNLMKFKDVNTTRALSNLNLIPEYNNYLINYESENIELLSNTGEVFNPYLNQKTALLNINISKGELNINYPINIVILPINVMDSSRIISQGIFKSNTLTIMKDFEIDSNNTILKGEIMESIKINIPENITHLILKKNNEIIFNSSLDNYYELIINSSHSFEIIHLINESYDFYWMFNNTIHSIERLNIKINNKVLLKSTSISQIFYENIKQIIFDYYSDYENGIIDFSNSIINNALNLKENLTIVRDLGNLVSINIPKNVYSLNNWDGLFIMPTLLKEYEFNNESILFAFKIGSEYVDLYTKEEFTITISGFSGFNVGFRNQTGVYEMPKTNYYDLGNDLVIKTKHLSTFFIYQKKQEIITTIEENNTKIKENNTIKQETNSNITLNKNSPLITGLITISNLNQADFLKNLRTMFCILMIFSTMFVLKKTIFQ